MSSELIASRSTPARPGLTAQLGPPAAFAVDVLMHPTAVRSPVSTLRWKTLIVSAPGAATYTKPLVAISHDAPSSGRFELDGHASVEPGSFTQAWKLSAPLEVLRASVVRLPLVLAT